MKSLFRATAILSGSSVISILVSLVSAKVMAVYLQPAGYGYFGLLQSFVALSSLVGGCGIATGMVRTGASAVTRHDWCTVATLRRAAWLLFAGSSVVALSMLAVFRTQISRWAVGDANHSGTILLMGIALVFTVAANIKVGILNSYHRVGALAKYGVANTILGATVSIAFILIWRAQGIVPAIIAGAISSFVVSSHFLRREVQPVTVQLSRRDIARTATSLLRFGGPYTASMLVGTGVQLALPMVVLHMLSTESVGYYRAAASISVGYLGFLVTAMGQDYYPRLSAVANQPTALAKLINEQHRLVMLVAVPMILGTLALVPLLVPLVYSLKFRPTVEILEWQLIGDLFKFSSWTMSFAILARAGSSAYFVIESIGGAATLTTTWLAVRWLGLPGLGISFLATYIIYYLVVWLITRREIPLVWTTDNKRMLLLGAFAACVVRILPSTRFAGFRTPAALILAFAVGIPSVITLWREFVSGKEPDLVAATANRTTAALTAQG
jgi:PST family polysaccharide transporter